MKLIPTLNGRHALFWEGIICGQDASYCENRKSGEVFLKIKTSLTFDSLLRMPKFDVLESNQSSLCLQNVYTIALVRFR